MDSCRRRRFSCMGGALVGLLYGLFGVGSAFATPLLALMGVPGVIAITAPLPGIMPGSIAGAWGYARRERVDWSMARRAAHGRRARAPCSAPSSPTSSAVRSCSCSPVSRCSASVCGSCFPGGASPERGAERRARRCSSSGSAFVGRRVRRSARQRRGVPARPALPRVVRPRHEPRLGHEPRRRDRAVGSRAARALARRRRQLDRSR